MSRLKNPTLRNRTEELCEHANNFDETFQIGCELQNIGRLIQGMSLHIRDLQYKFNSQAEHIKALLDKAGEQSDERENQRNTGQMQWSFRMGADTHRYSGKLFADAPCRFGGFTGKADTKANIRTY